MNENGRGLARDAALGALAGAAATWVMGRTTSWLYAREDPDARRREEAARNGKTAFVVAAEKGAGLLGRELDERQAKAWGSALHWGLGIGAGAAYGALRGRVPGVGRGRGAVFGTAFWLLVDEGANAALGLTPGPLAFPWQAHARGLAGHVVHGVVAATAFDLADRLT